MAILAVGVVGFWLVRQLDPPGTPGKPVNFTVNAGETIETLSARLEKQGFITSAAVFRWYAERQGDIVLTPGYYQLKPKDSMSNLLDSLRTPPAQTFIKVTFPEGFTLAQIASAPPAGRAAARRQQARCRSRPPGQIRSQYQPEGIDQPRGPACSRTRTRSPATRTRPRWCGGWSPR